MHSGTEWSALDATVTSIVIDSACDVEGASVTVLDFSRFANLTHVEVGNYAFLNVNEVKLVGLGALESVVIGRNCFASEPDSDAPTVRRCLTVKDCPKLTTLELGMGSFKSYSVCAIENNAALETLAFGKVSEEMSMFFSGSLELKSAFIRSEW